eukprot:NODE_71_length_24927_cov_1.205937.p16 type:complete len:211 gc:universal NODE_71_length_24927_cov_1.205937:22396-21764(-)
MFEEDSESEESRKVNKRPFIYILQVIFTLTMIILIKENESILKANIGDLSSPSYPSSSEVYTFRQDFTFTLTIVSLVYTTLFFLLFRFVATISKTIEQGGSTESKKTRLFEIMSSREFLKVTCFIDFAFVLIWAVSSIGFLFPLTNDSRPINIRGIACTASVDPQVSNQRIWKTACENTSWLIILGHLIYITFIADGLSILMKLKSTRSN